MLKGQSRYVTVDDGGNYTMSPCLVSRAERSNKVKNKLLLRMRAWAACRYYNHYLSLDITSHCIKKCPINVKRIVTFS